jgi:hypothetical protein
MTEGEWLFSADPYTMLGFVQDRTSYRKLRLFACACCRRIWGTALAASVLQGAVEAAERYADGMASESELVDVQNQLRAIEGLGISGVKIRLAESAAWLPSGYQAQHGSRAYGAHGASLRARLAEAIHEKVPNGSAASGLNKGAAQAQANILRCLVGNPFRPTTAINHAWIAWKDCTVIKIAQAIYAERAFDRMPILADALEDAGCDNADILAHCRGDGPHVRGCWVIDLLLGKS